LIDNLRAALDWAFSPDGDASIGVALTAATVPVWMNLSLMEEFRGRVEQALAALGAGANLDAPRNATPRRTGHIADINQSADAPEVAAALTKALEVADSLDDAEYQLRALWSF
jgi:ABC-type glycerol-3-phosphate transport system substrate-binding protein